MFVFAAHTCARVCSRVCVCVKNQMTQLVAARLAGERCCSLWQENPLARSLLEPQGFNYTADAFVQREKAPFELQN